MPHQAIAEKIKSTRAKIVLIYAFNAIGKTRLSIAYKDTTKSGNGDHSGVYYNAFSEDIFTWDNGDDNENFEIRLKVRHSSLSRFHSLLNENNIREKLIPYKPKYDFDFTSHDDPENGIEFISFYPKETKSDDVDPIKISRGEERIFVWCFFLALFEVEGWADKQPNHFFIDDPVSSLDDHNIFVTAATLLELIENHHKNRKIIITTHHIGLFSILADWLTKGEKSDRFKKLTELYTLSNKSGQLSLESCKEDVFLYHLRLLQVLEQAHREDNVRSFHFALLRQVLENIASFLGVAQFGYVLNQIEIEDPEEIANIINTLSHKKVYYYESDELVQDSKDLFKKVFTRIKDKYNFVLHA